jgi:hypothetical protein
MTQMQKKKSREVEMVFAELQITPAEEDVFAYIVEVALRSDLPPRWKKKVDGNGATYYLDTDSDSSTYENPLMPYMRQVVEVGRMYLKAPSFGFFEKQANTLWQLHRGELADWHGPVQDESGNNYFINGTTQTSSWHDPRLAAQHYFDVQSKLLKHLETTLSTGVVDDGAGAFGAGQAPMWEQGAPSLEERMLGQSKPVSPSGTGFVTGRSQKSVRVAKAMEDEMNPVAQERYFQLTKMSNAADWMHEASKSEEALQLSQLQARRAQQLEESRMKKLSLEFSEMVHAPESNMPVFLSTAPLEDRFHWSHSGSPWRDHVGFAPWEMWAST